MKAQWSIAAAAALAMVHLVAAPLLQAVTVPVGTPVYCEMQERVTSKKKETSVGDLVRAQIWRDVVVDGRVVLEAGAPVMARVSHVKKARFAGLKGQLEIEAVSATAVDGTDLLLDGGYDKSGKGRKGLSITLAAVVAWPLIFIKGKQAVLDPGTIFDATVQSTTEVAAGGSARPTIKIGSGPTLAAEVLYDEMDPDTKIKWLPLSLEACGASLDGLRVLTVNDEQIDPIPVEVRDIETGNCTAARGSIELKPLSKSFRRGINRFEIGTGELRREIVLDVEL